MSEFKMLKNLSIEELLNLEKACMIIYTKLQNETIALRGQTIGYDTDLNELEMKGAKYGKIRNKILDEIENRISNIINEEN